jgi:RNA polymerase sigma-70 factor (ECF subfamily)
VSESRGPHFDLDSVFREHQRSLLGLAIKITGDRTSAEDALQDAMLCAHLGAKGFRGDSSPSTWLYRIVVRASLRVRREKECDRRHTAAQAIHSKRLGREARDAGVVDEEAVLAALNALPEDQRLALVLLSVRELSAEEIAVMLDIPPNTVYTRAFRGRLRIRELIGLGRASSLHNPAAIVRNR